MAPREALRPVVDAAWLAEHISAPDLRAIDCRWFYDHDSGTATSGRAAYEAGHVPGAAFVDVDQDATGTGPGRRLARPAGTGRRPA